MIVLVYLLIGAIVGVYVETGDEEPLNTAELIIITVMWLPFLVMELFSRIFFHTEIDDDEGDFTDDTF